MPTIKVGQRTISDENAGILPINLSKVVFNPEEGSKGTDYNTVLLRILHMLGTGLGAETITRKYQIASDEYDQRQIAIVALPSPANTGTTMTVTAGTGKLLRPGFRLYNLNTEETFFISAVAGDILTVTRDFGAFLGGGSAATANTDNLVILGEAAAEGSASGDSITNQVNLSYNYTSFIRTPVELSEHDIKATTEIGSAWDRARARNLKIHMGQLEHEIWYGRRSAGTHPLTGKPLHTTGGILQHLVGNVTDLSGTAGLLSEREMDRAMEIFFINGCSEKYGFCGSHFISALTSFAKNKVVFNDIMSKKMGMHISEYQAGGNMLYLVQHKKVFTGHGATGSIGTTNGNTLASKLVVLDIPKVKLRHFTGMGTTLHTDIGANDVSGTKDEYRTTIGVEMQPGIDDPRNAASQPEQYASCHSMLEGFDTY